MPEHAVRQRRVEEAHERVRRRPSPERPGPGPAARDQRAENNEGFVGGPYVALPRARGPDCGDEAKPFLDLLRGLLGQAISPCEQFKLGLHESLSSIPSEAHMHFTAPREIVF